MHEDRVRLGDVPTRIYRPRDARSLLLLGHGGGHSNDSDRFVSLCRYFATETGQSVVCIDAVDHGERRPTAATGDLPPAWHSRAVPPMVADWRFVVDQLASIGPATSYVGFSMGAIFGVSIVRALPSIAATVLVAGGIPGRDWTNDPDIAEVLTDGAARLAHTHVLMLNKDDDELFPAENSRRLFDSLSGCSKQLRYSFGGHDEWDRGLLEDAAVFVARYGLIGA